jgi:hypothetical protein
VTCKSYCNSDFGIIKFEVFKLGLEDAVVVKATLGFGVVGHDFVDTGLGWERGSYNERIRVDKFDVWDFGFVLTISSNGSSAGIYVCEKRAIGEVYMSISASGHGVRD